MKRHDKAGADSMVIMSSYAFAVGHNVALANLNNVEASLGSRNRKIVGGITYPVSVKSTPINLYPVRVQLGSGRERGDGRVYHAWTLQLVTYGVKYLFDTYLAGLASVSTAVTIYTRRHEFDTYARYNAYLVQPAAGELEYIRSGVFQVQIRFNDLVSL